MPIDWTEKRRFPRIKARLRIGFFNAEGQREDHLTDNISLSGTCIEDNMSIPIGEQREFFISLPDGSYEFTALGKVVNHQPKGTGGAGGMGIHFILIEPSQKKDFQRFIQILLEQKGLGTREHPRVASIFNVNLSVDGKIRDEKVYDVSRGGMGIMTADPLQLGYLVEIHFKDPKHLEQPLELKGEIRSSVRITSTHHRLGIKFLDVSDDDQKSLEQFILNITGGN